MKHNPNDPQPTPDPVPQPNAKAAAAPTIIRPTIGRVVWYWREPPTDPATQPEAAIVAYVHGDNLVNLHVIDRDGGACGVKEVTLRQAGDGIPSTSFCEWMPYQLAQSRANTTEPEK